MAIVVVIENGGVARPSFSLQTGFRRDVRERPIFIIMIENVVFLGAFDNVQDGSLTRVVFRSLIIILECPGGGLKHEKVEKTIVVIVEEDGPLAMPDVDNACVLGDVLERAIVLIVKQDVAAARTGHEEVLPAVVVVIGEGSHRADAIAKTDPGFLCNVPKGAVSSVLEERILPE